MTSEKQNLSFKELINELKNDSKLKGLNEHNKSFCLVYGVGTRPFVHLYPGNSALTMPDEYRYFEEDTDVDNIAKELSIPLDGWYTKRII